MVLWSYGREQVGAGEQSCCGCPHERSSLGLGLETPKSWFWSGSWSPESLVFVLVLNKQVLITSFAFSAFMLLVGQQEWHPACKKQRWDAGVVLSGSRCRFAYGPADATATHYLCSSKARLVLPFWCQLTRVVPNKIQEGRKMVCACACDNQLGNICDAREPIGDGKQSRCGRPPMRASTEAPHWRAVPCWTDWDHRTIEVLCAFLDITLWDSIFLDLTKFTDVQTCYVFRHIQNLLSVLNAFLSNANLWESRCMCDFINTKRIASVTIINWSFL